MTDPTPKNSDLGVRTLSAIVMVAVAGTALWLGAWLWTAFLASVAVGLLWEWRNLVRGFVGTAVGQSAWLISGMAYIGFAVAVLMALREMSDGGLPLLIIVLSVIGTDVGAYFAGRTFGGPKIAPSISPSKTWSGLVGGMTGASLMVLLVTWAWHSGLCNQIYGREAWWTRNPPAVFGFDGPCSFVLPPTDYWLLQSAMAGAVIAVVAQCGDFFESWMKRKAGVKDSSNLIPGHGGLFDRADGLLAVTCLVGILQFAGILR